MKLKSLLLTLFALVSATVALTALYARPTTAQDAVPPQTMRQLIESLVESESAFTIEFALPLVSGERTWAFPDARSRRTVGQVGDDFVCFSEPWNDGRRSRCTPFSNLVSLVYSETP